MPKRIVFFIILCFFALSAKSQEMMLFTDGKPYPATGNWNFICQNYALTGILEVQVAKTAGGGLLRLSAEVTDGGFYIGGTVYLFLADGAIITCTDKQQRAYKAPKAAAFYSLTPSEMKKLGTTAITDVRFAIAGKENAFSSQTGHFTATNRKKYFEGYDKSIRNSYPTEFEISALYK